MIDLTRTEADAIKGDVYTRDILMRDVEFNEHKYPGKYNNTRKKKEIEMLNDRIRRYGHIAPDQNIGDIIELVYYTLNMPQPKTRYLTINDLPKETRETRFPKRQKPEARAKKLAKFINRMRAPGVQYRDGEGRSMGNMRWDGRKQRHVIIPRYDSITHLASGRVWDASTGATQEEFLEVV